MTKVLIVDDEPLIRRILSVMLSENNFEVTEVESGEQAIDVYAILQPEVVLLDVKMPGMDGLTTLGAILSQGKACDCIMMTAYGTIRSAVEAMRLGAFDYLTKPFDNDELLMIINRALELRKLSSEVEDLRVELSSRYGFNEIIGISPKLQGIFRTMVKVAPVEATVLIEGESGTGKELIARAIHRHSSRAAGPFVAVNCSAIPQSLFEAEFFGYERGAFTDAKERHAGHFERARGGTLFLDEVGELPLESQAKLLRALQEREVTRLGGHAPIKVDARVIAATNVNLESAISYGRFREDFYWRLNVVKLTVPSLRERREDIPLIVDHLVERFNSELGLAISTITPDARRLLQSYDWPGNVRELENAVCSAMVMCEAGVVSVRDLPGRVRGLTDEEALGVNGVSDRSGIGKLTLAEAVKAVTEKLEMSMIIARLAEMNGNRTATAESLGISRKTLFNKMRQYGLGGDEPEDNM
jgi:DNA-binding NtrC family response regulator